MISVVGAAVGGVIGWSAEPPPVDDPTLRTLLEAAGQPHFGDLAEAVRAFQERAGLAPDGIAGPRTVHLLVRHARMAV
jgi:hypothetical protein